MSVVVQHDRMTLGDALRRLSAEERPRGALSSDGHYASLQWDLNTDFKAASEFARDGWRVKAQELERLMLEIRNITPEGFSFSHDVTGECVDIGAYLSGEPECMIAVLPPRTRNVSLVVNIAARSSADATLLLNRGIAVASLVHSLQSCAYGVSLKVGEWVRPREGSGDYHETLIEVNQAGEYIDPARLAFWLAHPAALRRCIFRYNEQRDLSTREKFGFIDMGGYGYPSNPPENYTPVGGAIMIPFPETSSLHNYSTPAKALDEISKIVSAQGLTLKKDGSL